MVTYGFRAYLFKEQKMVDVSYVSYMKNRFIEHHHREDISIEHNMKDGAIMHNTFIKDNNEKLIYVDDFIEYNKKKYRVKEHKIGERYFFYLFDENDKPFIDIRKARASGFPLKIVGNVYNANLEE